MLASSSEAGYKNSGARISTEPPAWSGIRPSIHGKPTARSSSPAAIRSFLTACAMAPSSSEAADPSPTFATATALDSAAPSEAMMVETPFLAPSARSRERSKTSA